MMGIDTSVFMLDGIKSFTSVFGKIPFIGPLSSNDALQLVQTKVP
jgi:hypothetical protein